MSELELRRNIVSSQSSGEKVWIRGSELKLLSNATSIPVYAWACDRSKKYSSSSCRLGLSLVPHDNFFYHVSGSRPNIAMYVLEGYYQSSTYQRIAFVHDAIGYDSGWKNIYEQLTVTDLHGNTANCTVYYNSDANKIISSDPFGPTVAYLYMYQMNTRFDMYLFLVDASEL